MNINLNLATRPYIELRSVYTRLRVVAVALAVLALPMLLVIHSAETRAQLAQARVQQLQDNIALLRQQQNRARQLAVEGSNASVLTEAAFLNDLFRRKSFSWTATMSDLENTLPYGVQVDTIQPVIAPDGHVTIRMRVTGAREHTVDLIRNLEHSRHFVGARLVTEGLADQSAAGQTRRVNTGFNSESNTGGANDVNFDIQAEYRPLPNSHDQAGVLAATARAHAPSTNPHPNGLPVKHRAAKPIPGQPADSAVR